MRHAATAEARVGERAGHQPARRRREEQPVDAPRDAEQSDQHERRPGHVREQAAEVERDDERVADAHTLAQHAHVAAKRAAHLEPLVRTWRERLAQAERRDREQHGAPRRERGVDRAPSAHRRHRDAEGGRDDRRDAGGEVHVRLPDARLGAGEVVAHHGDDEHVTAAGAGAHEKAPEQHGAERARGGAERAEQGEHRDAAKEHRPAAHVIRQGAEHERAEREAGHEHAERERGPARGDAERRRHLVEHGEAHVRGERGQRREGAEQDGEGDGFRAETAHPRKLNFAAANPAFVPGAAWPPHRARPLLMSP